MPELTIDDIVDKTIEPELQHEYLVSLSPKEKQAVLIAASHLGMSFQLKKSVGYLSWKMARVVSR
jgi:hypothetical protein